MTGVCPWLAVATLLAIVSVVPAKLDAQDPQTRFSRCDPNAGTVHDYTVETLDGNNVSMSRYAGNYLVIVNVATFCKYTEQYLDFNPLLNHYTNQGVYIAAFPCNQFHLQEPGNNSEIINGIKYVRPGKGFQPDRHLHIFGKLDVNGKKAHPMYNFLKDACPPTGDLIGQLEYFFWDEVHSNDIVWNFEKFIVDRQGRPVYRFHPGAWNHGKFVEKHLTELLANEKRGNAAGQPSVTQPEGQVRAQH